MYLFYDTETTGLPRSWDAPMSRVANWPRMVQLAWMIYDEDGTLESKANYIIKPEGYTIPLDASKVHGITTEIALKTGVDLRETLIEFVSVVEKAKLVIAHNMDFDEKIVGAELIRTEIESKLFEKPRLCTMKTTTNLCKLPGPYGYKWPKLIELYSILFGSDFEDAHDASADVAACAKCFFHLKEKGHYNL
jgi:DNA polymerase-3 subunit epsilon